MEGFRREFGYSAGLVFTGLCSTRFWSIFAPGPDPAIVRKVVATFTLFLALLS